MPAFRCNEADVKAMHAKEQNANANTQNAFTAATNAIAGNKDRLMMTVLFVMPNEMIVSADMDSSLPPTYDQKAKFRIREQTLKFETGTNKTQHEQKQTFGFWLMRVISEERRLLQVDSDESEDDLDAALNGMNI